jgi:hypothetical protein
VLECLAEIGPDQHASSRCFVCFGIYLSLCPEVLSRLKSSGYLGDQQNSFGCLATICLACGAWWSYSGNLFENLFDFFAYSGGAGLDYGTCRLL